MTAPREYACDRCGGTFQETDGSEERAQAEAERLWGQGSTGPMPMSKVCDPCFREFMQWYVENGE